MALYAIGDLHLSLNSNKPMDIFGEGWHNYVERIREGFSTLTDEDVTVLCGDLSWGMSLEESLEDFRFIDALPGKKILMKGNHDYWWNTAAKMTKFFEEHELTTLSLLHNNCLFYGDKAICGTRGWITEPGQQSDIKVLNREVGRLKASLESCKAEEKIVFLHYPPVFGNIECNEITQVLAENNIKTCYYGHLHGYAHRLAVHDEERNGTRFFLASADFTGFTPIRIL